MACLLDHLFISHPGGNCSPTSLEVVGLMKGIIERIFRCFSENIWNIKKNKNPLGKDIIFTTLCYVKTRPSTHLLD